MKTLIYKLRKLIGQHVPKPTDKFKTFVFEGNCMDEFYTYCALTVSIDSETPDPNKLTALKSRVIIWDNNPLKYHNGQRLPIYTEKKPEPKLEALSDVQLLE